MEGKIYQTNKVNLELTRQLKERDDEIDLLKQYVIELKNRQQTYIPLKDDPIDEKLANFLNEENPKFKLNFSRESSGHYLFGSMKV